MLHSVYCLFKILRKKLETVLNLGRPEFRVSLQADQRQKAWALWKENTVLREHETPFF